MPAFPMPVTIGLWVLRVAVVLMLPGIRTKLIAIALMVAVPLLRRLIVPHLRARLETQKGNDDATEYLHTTG